MPLCGSCKASYLCGPHLQPGRLAARFVDRAQNQKCGCGRHSSRCEKTSSLPSLTSSTRSDLDAALKRCARCAHPVPASVLPTVSRRKAGSTRCPIAKTMVACSARNLCLWHCYLLGGMSLAGQLRNSRVSGLGAFRVGVAPLSAITEITAVTLFAANLLITFVRRSPSAQV